MRPPVRSATATARPDIPLLQQGQLCVARHPARGNVQWPAVVLSPEQQLFVPEPASAPPWHRRSEWVFAVRFVEAIPEWEVGACSVLALLQHGSTMQLRRPAPHYCHSVL